MARLFPSPKDSHPTNRTAYSWPNDDSAKKAPRPPISTTSTKEFGTYCTEMFKIGLVPLWYDKQACGFVRRDECIRISGKWMKKIEFIMRELGAARVTEELKKVSGGKSVFELLNLPDARDKYIHVREILLEAALKKQQAVR